MQYLRDLNNADKHRLLLVVVASFDYRSTIWVEGPGDPKPKSYVNLAPIEDGDELITFDFEGAQPPGQFDPSPFRLVPRFNEGQFGTPLHDHALMNVLALMEYKTERIIGTIAQDLAL